MPREYTEAEVRQMLLEHIWSIVDTWSETQKPVRDRIAGCAFSILAMIDGSATGLPGFLLIPGPHPDDKEFRRSRGENWFPDSYDCDIAGSLHEEFYKAEKRKR